MARLVVRLTPKAAADRIDGWDQDDQGRAVLMVRVTAPPIDGRANAALILVLAKALKVPKSRLSLVSGDTSRLKHIDVDGLDDATLFTVLGNQA